ncbi:pyruvate dehydrogenase E2 component (dihydrolipoamide acetyltransferase) [Hasllibacter halocynthiae]|uniref:Pyruvate dehydrogenase E2 component (Dihydrolipoamide acetyltransferase) n=1 Tax=Hasllibacter halocynthiae TaxID=595589 RepID=A0A2T0X9W5_9RHOB|nr:2-oxo acid dehydrogenase subunit E2 [Hasllibacter halocynthiae]PRY95719.1 pyruvate dehydrogenase E2 component (dihydrolipoamide acetyltransferase) [Hasllibacter halocynthiae]
MPVHKLSPVQRQVAKAVARSAAEAAACTVFADLDAAPLQAALAALERPRPTVTHLIAVAAARALTAHPVLNAHLDGDALDMPGAVHLGLAMALPEGGLIAPVIRDAHAMDAVTLARAARDLAERAARGALAPADMRGATFTLSSAGRSPTPRYATPLIPLPQVAIMAITAIREAPVIRDGAVASGLVLPVSLTFDHRALNGAAANEFLDALAGRLADPADLLRPETP